MARQQVIQKGAQSGNLMHSEEVFRIHERILKESPAEGRFIHIGEGCKIHVIEAGMGPPLVYLHGGGAAAHTILPLIEHLEGVRMIVPDRPGNGLSDPVEIGRAGYRAMAVKVVDQILDMLVSAKFHLPAALGAASGRSGMHWPIRNAFAG